MPPGAFSAYADGRKAHAAGAHVSACPYGRDAEQRRAEWRWGWWQAEDDARGPPQEGVLQSSTLAAQAAKHEALNGPTVRAKSRWA
jgi:hypothetical protein